MCVRVGVTSTHDLLRFVCACVKSLIWGMHVRIQACVCVGVWVCVCVCLLFGTRICAFVKTWIWGLLTLRRFRCGRSWCVFVWAYTSTHDLLRFVFTYVKTWIWGMQGMHTLRRSRCGRTLAGICLIRTRERE